MTRAESLVHAPTLLLYLGRAEEQLGHLVKAHEAYVKIVREKLSPDAPDAFVEAQSDARKLLQALEPRLPYLKVVLAGSTSRAPEVTMDGTRVPNALVGIFHPVDPGTHMFRVKAPGMQTDSISVRLEEGEQKEIKLTLHPAATGGSPGGPTGAAPPVALPRRVMPRRAAMRTRAPLLPMAG